MTTSKKARNSSVKRGEVKDTVRVALWAKSAGRCNMCNARLLGSGRTFLHTVLVGELAHNVGATESDDSPRSDGTASLDREGEENLLLLCHDCHRIVDNKDHVPYFTIERLQQIKRSHEDRITRSTDHGGMTRTAALRLAANVKGSPAYPTQREVADALLHGGFLGLVEGRWQGDFSATLTGDPSRRYFWEAGQDEIDATLSQVRDAIKSQDVSHLSVFAIAPIPLLVHLGVGLDDKTPTRIYQKQRAQDHGWRWDDTAGAETFTHTAPSVISNGPDEPVLIVAISGDPSHASLPPDLQGSPTFTIRPQGAARGPEVFRSHATLENFASAWRVMLADVERLCPSAPRWHLAGAIPVSAGVEIGRSLMRGTHPPTLVYELHNNEYQAVLTVNA